MRKIKRLYYNYFYNVSISKDSVFEGVDCRFDKCNVSILDRAIVKVGRNVSFNNCNINIIGGELYVGDNVHMSDFSLQIGERCKLSIGQSCVFEQGDNWRKPYVILWGRSCCTIGHHNRVRCDIMCRFGGTCSIKEYNCFNERTEIRCDENISIGAYNMISYNCRIWDTDTHTFYEDDFRKRMTEKMYPNIGAEVDKPQTSMVSIGDDNLLGENAVVLKGTTINNRVKIGYGTIVSNRVINNAETVVGSSCRVLKF